MTQPALLITRQVLVVSIYVKPPPPRRLHWWGGIFLARGAGTRSACQNAFLHFHDSMFVGRPSEVPLAGCGCLSRSLVAARFVASIRLKRPKNCQHKNKAFLRMNRL